MYVFTCWVQNVLIRRVFFIQYEFLQTVSISTKASVFHVNIRTVERCYFLCLSTDGLVNTARLQIRVRMGENYFLYFSSKTHVVGNQKKRLNETVLLSTQNTCLN